jgi:hypothetical protein
MTSTFSTPSTIANAGPLKTIFTTPASCLYVTNSLQFSSEAGTSPQSCFRGLSCGSISATDSNSWSQLTECLLSNVLLNSASAGNPSDLVLNTILYSPGLLCPRGYTSVLQQTGSTLITQTGFILVYNTSPLMAFAMETLTTQVSLEAVAPGETTVASCQRTQSLDLYRAHGSLGGCVRLVSTASYPIYQDHSTVLANGALSVP